jgi:hypothetical protein
LFVFLAPVRLVQSPLFRTLAQFSIIVPFIVLLLLVLLVWRSRFDLASE